MRRRRTAVAALVLAGAFAACSVEGLTGGLPLEEPPEEAGVREDRRAPPSDTSEASTPDDAGLDTSLPDTAPPPLTGILYDFETDTAGWKAGANIQTVSREKSFLNGPQKPYHGDYVLLGQSAIVSATQWHMMGAAVDPPIDLSKSDNFVYYISSYGGVPGATYETRVVLTTASNKLDITRPYEADQWNEIAIDVTGLGGRNAVTAIEIGYRAVGNDMPWKSQFEIDALRKR